MRLVVPWVFVLLLVPPAGAELLVSGFAPDLPGSEADDAFELLNTGPGSVDLTNVQITDEEGVLGFPAGTMLSPGQRLRIALRSSAYEEAAGRQPDMALDSDDPNRGLVELESNFLLARTGDEILVLLEGRVMDAVVYGDDRKGVEGWLGPAIDVRGNPFLDWYERDGAEDHDTADDWSRPQVAKLGWRSHEVPDFHVASLGTAFTAPDQSRTTVERLIASAQESLRINVYEFLDVGLASLLQNRLAQSPALDLRVLVDGEPVGLDAEERLIRNRILSELQDAGAEIRLLRHDRYNFNHAKYAVADQERVIVQSENFVRNGVPPDGATGNRGWGLLIEDSALAQALADVFDEDFELDPYAARRLGPDDFAEIPLPEFIPDIPRPRLSSVEARDFNVTLIVGPEANLQDDDAVVRTIREAASEIVVEQLQLPSVWRSSGGREWPNQYLDALLNAARRGVHVRILLDGHFLDDGPDNGDTADWLQSEARGLPLEVRLAGENMRVLHVKGMVVDGRRSLVGSMNWNLNSVGQNREVDLLVDEPEFAALYLQAFEIDWAEAAEISAEGVFPTPGLPATVIIVAALALALVPRRRQE